jgi:hypothetical protein
MKIRSNNFQSQKVDSLNPTQPVIYLEITAVVVPVTAKVHRMSSNWMDDTFHFCCSLFNMMQREEKKGFILYLRQLFL